MAKLASLGGTFSKDINVLANVLRKWPQSATKELEAAHRRIGKNWQAQAIKRVPVKSSRLQKSIVTNTFREGQAFVTEVGSNVKYAPFTEFGTRHIAGGRVLALGSRVDIADADAVHDWPAKAEGGVAGGRSGNAAVDAALAARASRGSANEQMPWLRPAFQSIKDWAIQELTRATEPPKR